MKREFMEKWVAALRSGEYEQAQGTLHDGRGYCCLGVAECVAGSKFTRSGDAFVVNDSFASAYLSDETQSQGGFNNSGGQVDDYSKILVGGRYYDGLAEANDDEQPFAAIADAIEANWERL